MKIKKRKHAKRAFFSVLQNAPFRSQIFTNFFASGGKRAFILLTEILRSVLGRASVCLSVPSFGRRLQLRRVCCCGPAGLEISIDCCTAGAQQQMRAVSRCQLRRLRLVRTSLTEQSAETLVRAVVSTTATACMLYGVSDDRLRKLQVAHNADARYTRGVM